MGVLRPGGGCGGAGANAPAEEAIPEAIITPEFVQAEQAKAEAMPDGDMSQSEVRQQSLARVEAMRTLVNQRQ